jgi:hypothetical protein
VTAPPVRCYDVGDIVLAGAGIRAELRSIPDDNPDTAVVRWIDEHGYGWQHSRVPWSTVRPFHQHQQERR